MVKRLELPYWGRGEPLFSLQVILMVKSSVLLHSLQARLWSLYYQVFTPMKLMKAASFPCAPQTLHHCDKTNLCRCLRKLPPETTVSNGKIVVKMSVPTVTDIATQAKVYLFITD